MPKILLVPFFPDTVYMLMYADLYLYRRLTQKLLETLEVQKLMTTTMMSVMTSQRHVILLAYVPCRQIHVRRPVVRRRREYPGTSSY